MQYSHHFADALVDHGISTMFGVPGDANMYLSDAFVRLPETRFVNTAHESGAVLMAAGFGATSGGVGAATVTHGAISNCVSALFEAVRGRYPLVLIAGDTARQDQKNLQNIPQRDVVTPTGAGYVEAGSPEAVIHDLDRAVHEAVTGRRPVVLNIPSDFQTVDCEPIPFNRSVTLRPRTVPARDALEDAAAAIADSNRPVILAGLGAAGPDAAGAIAALAGRIGAPVSTTLRGQGLFAADSCHLGVFGTLSGPVATTTIANSDCIVVFGASLNAHTTLKGELLQGKMVIQIDEDPLAVGKWYPVDLALVGDAEASASALTDLLDELETAPTRYRNQALEDELRSSFQQEKDIRSTDYLDLRDALHRINALLPPERTLAIDAGRFCHQALRIVRAADPSHYLHAINIAHIGMSLSYGVGGALGAPQRPSVVVIGDGGFMLGGLAEFNTAVRNAADLIVFVINDSAYGAEYYRFVNDGLDVSLATFDWPDLAEVARSLGGTGVSVRELADFDLVERALASRDRPLLVDVRLDKDTVPAPGVQ